MQHLSLLFRVSFSLRCLLLLGSGLVLLDQGLVAQAQIIPNGAGTLVNPQGNQINITGGTQAGANLFHSFRDFNLTPAQIANFLSNPQTQNILARINGGNPSLINGLLQVTGGNSNLFLMNPAGIVFGQGASLNVPASFTATTANQIGFGNNQYFSATGNNNYADLIGNPTSFIFNTTQAGSIVNAGNLTVGNGQNISLIAGNTINTGSLSAPGGEIQVLAVPGTNRVRLSQPGQVLSLEIVPPVDGTLKAVDLPALLTGSGDLPGIGVNPTGQVQVVGTSLPNQQGIAVASGRIDVSSATGNGGTVQVLGDTVAALDSRINANGATGGGMVRLGGEYLGGRDTGIAPALRFNSQRTLVNRNSLISANARTSGNGGRVIVWADDTTGFYGRITGRGATGNGGFAEVSGRVNLDFDGRVELPGANGLFGTLLLDPTNIIIQAAAGNGDGLLPNILVGDTPANMTLSVGALAAIAPTTAINITASNNIDLNVTVYLNPCNTGTCGAVSFTAGGAFNANNNDIYATGRDLSIRAASITVREVHTSVATASTRGGNITLNAVDGDIISTARLSPRSFLSGGTGNGGDINLIARGNINTSIVDSDSSAGNGGAINFSAGGNITTSNVLNTDSSAGNGGAINFSAGGNITISNVLNTYSISSGNGGDINLTAQGNITTDRFSSSSTSGNGGAITLNSSQGSITTDIINTNTNTGNAGAVNFTSQGNITTRTVRTNTLIGNGGAVSFNTLNGNIIAENIFTQSINTGNSGTININTPQGNTTIWDIISAANIGNGGAANITSQGNIITRAITSGSIARNGAAINLTSQGNITTGGINSRGDGAGNISGTINITAGNLFRITGICGGPSICSDGQNGAGNGAITIRHGGGTTTPFIVGNSAINGTEQRINAGVGSIITTTTTIPVPPATYTQGIVNIITNASPVVPPVTPAASPTISPELFTLLRNPAPPATPAPVVVGTPPVSPVVEPPISVTPIVAPPVVPTPQPSPVVITNPIPTPIPSPVVVATPIPISTPIPSPVVVATPIPISTPSTSPTLTPPLRTVLANINPQESLPNPEPSSGNLTLITNPPNSEISSRLSRAFGNAFPFTSSQASYNLSEIQNNLNQTTQTTGIKPALIYVFFTPHSSGIRDNDTLEIILITEKGEPLRVQFPDITRRQVLAVANSLRDSSMHLAPANNNEVRDNDPSELILINRMGEAYRLQLTNANRLITRLTAASSGVFDLNTAQQMYQWLLAPLEQELQQQGINNLVFVVDQELRSLPLESLYDGQGFIRERYTISRP